MNFKTTMKEIDQIRNYRLINSEQRLLTNAEIMIKN